MNPKSLFRQKTKIIGIVTSLMDELAGEIADDRQSDTIETEIFKYFSAPTIPRVSEPLDWWRAQTEYPSLKKVAKKFLTSPLSSVYSERLFSQFGNIYEEKTLPKTFISSP